jgi:hypothetical protein
VAAHPPPPVRLAISGRDTCQKYLEFFGYSTSSFALQWAAKEDKLSKMSETSDLDSNNFGVDAVNEHADFPSSHSSRREVTVELLLKIAELLSNPSVYSGKLLT